VKNKRILIVSLAVTLMALVVAAGCSSSSATDAQMMQLQNQVNSLGNSLDSTQQELSATQQQLATTQQNLETTKQALTEAQSKQQQQSTTVTYTKPGSVYLPVYRSVYQPSVIYRTYPYVYQTYPYYYRTYPYTTPWYPYHAPWR